MKYGLYCCVLLLATVIAAQGYAIPPFLIGNHTDLTIYEGDGEIVHRIRTNHPIIATTSFLGEDGTPTAAVLTFQPWHSILGVEYFQITGETSKRYQPQSVKVPNLEEEQICPTILYENGGLHAFYIDPHTANSLKIISFKEGSDSTLGLMLVDTFLLQSPQEIQKNNVFLTKLHEVQRVLAADTPYYVISASTRHTQHGGALGFSVFAISSALPFTDGHKVAKRMASTHSPLCLSLRAPTFWQVERPIQMRAYVDDTNTLNALLAVPTQSRWGFSATDTYHLRFDDPMQTSSLRCLQHAQTYGYPIAFTDFLREEEAADKAAISTITSLSPYSPFQGVFSLWGAPARVPCAYEINGSRPDLGATHLPLQMPAGFCPERALRAKEGFLLITGQVLEEGIRGWLGFSRPDNIVHLWQTKGASQAPAPIFTIESDHPASHVAFFPLESTPTTL